MTALIRPPVGQVLSQLNVGSHRPHGGLLLTRSLAVRDPNDPEKRDKKRLIDRVCAIQADDFYAHALSRWKRLTADRQQFAVCSAALQGRMMMGLSTGGALETGATTHHSYGLPMIPGSALKGVAQAYARDIGLNPSVLNVLFGEDEDSAQGSDRQAGAGYLIWHDAWWDPGQGQARPFVDEVVTVHHQEYYANTQAEATDFDSPIPNQQMAVQGSFYFVVEGDPAWGSFALSVLKKALAHRGIGAKTAAGYGFFEETAASGAGAAVGSRAAGSVQSEDLVWPQAKLTLDKGRGLLVAVSAQGRAEAPLAKLTLTDALKAALDKKKEPKRDVKVLKKGNRFELTGIVEP